MMDFGGLVVVKFGEFYLGFVRGVRIWGDFLFVFIVFY